MSVKRPIVSAVFHSWYKSKTHVSIHKYQPKKKRIYINNLAIALLTVQVKFDDLKKEVISTVADLITKLKYADKAFTDELVTKVDHNQLNITTKVYCQTKKIGNLTPKYDPTHLALKAVVIFGVKLQAHFIRVM